MLLAICKHIPEMGILQQQQQQKYIIMISATSCSWE